MPTYTMLWVSVQEDLSASLSADVGSDLLELASRALSVDLDGISRNLVGEHSAGVLPSSKN